MDNQLTPTQSKRHQANSNVYDGMTEEEEDAFIENLSSSFTSMIPSSKGVMSPSNVFALTELLIKQTGEVAKFCELQETKRTEIRTKAEVAIHHIDAIRDIIQDYLEKSFDERSKIFKKEFEVVDYALKSGNNEMLAVSLNSITDLAKSSPFKALADVSNVKHSLENKEIEFEI